MSASDLLSIFDNLELFPGAERALCKEVGPGPFFPPMGSNGHEGKRICAQCPVRDACERFAVEEFIREGIWGGTTRMDRRRIWKERGMTPPDEEDEEMIA